VAMVDYDSFGAEQLQGKSCSLRRGCEVPGAAGFL